MPTLGSVNREKFIIVEHKMQHEFEQVRILLAAASVSLHSHRKGCSKVLLA